MSSSGGKNAGESSPDYEIYIDDYYIKAMIILSILIICITILASFILYLQIRMYQNTRQDILEETLQMDQIEYLIVLLEEQEKILKMEMEGRSVRYVEKELARFVALHREFSDSLEGLHDMLVERVAEDESRAGRWIKSWKILNMKKDVRRKKSLWERYENLFSD